MARPRFHAAMFGAAAVCALSATAFAGTITTTSDPTTLANAIAGSGTTISNATYSGASGASGTFNGFGAAIGIDTGIILTSGSAASAVGPNNSDATSTDNGILTGDADLDSIVSNDTMDPTIFQFDFTTTGGNLFFNYVFASEEYEEWVGSAYNDVFGFFLDGTNIAVVPSTTTPITINSVNQNLNSTFYHSNTNGAFDTQYDGFTTVLTAQMLGVGSGTHHIKLAIADRTDRIYDSAVFIQGRSFSDTETEHGEAVPLPAAGWMGLSVLGGLAVVRGLRRRKNDVSIVARET